MHKIESSLSTRAGAARGRRGVRAWLRNRAAVPATSPAPVSTPINPTVRVGSERGGATVPTCPRRPRPSARSERHQRGGVDEKMQKAKSIFADFLSREIFTSAYEPARLPRGERQWAGNAALRKRIIKKLYHAIRDLALRNGTMRLGAPISKPTYSNCNSARTTPAPPMRPVLAAFAARAFWADICSRGAGFNCLIED